MRKIRVLLLAVVFSAGLAYGAGTVEQKTQIKFGGFIGGVINVFGGKATKEGVNTVSTVQGDRRAMVMGNTGELVDLKEEKIYQIDFGRKSYRVITFEEMRKQFEEVMKQAQQQPGAAEEQSQEGPELEIDVDVQETGAKQTIGSYDTRQVVVTVTAREKGKTLEESGGAVLTADLWLGPRIAAVRELEQFERKYMQKLYGSALGEGDMRSMAMLLATSPAFGKVMKKLQEKQGAMEGTAIRSSIKFETVAAPRAEASAAAGGPELAAKALGGLLSRSKKKREGESSAAGPDKRMLFFSSSELINVSPSADSAALALPAGFSQRK